MFSKDVDTYRRRHLAVAEFVDAWRVVPRLLVVGYIWLLVHVTTWYMDLRPYLLDGCDVSKLGKECLVQAPSTQHAALITAIVGVAAAIFGLYTSSSKKWDRFVPWNLGSLKPEPPPEKEDESSGEQVNKPV